MNEHHSGGDFFIFGPAVYFQGYYTTITGTVLPVLRGKRAHFQKKYAKQKKSLKLQWFCLPIAKHYQTIPSLPLLC